MRQNLDCTNQTKDGVPTGGTVRGMGIIVDWQNGALGRGEDRAKPNGAFVEDLIQAVIGRISYYQKSRFACQENADALEALETAARRLDDRTKSRENRKVEGTHKE